VLREDNVLIPTTLFGRTGRNLHPDSRQSYEQARDYVRRHWKYCEPAISGDSDNLLERARSHFLCISGMAFQDAWNIDLGRLHRCCIHVLVPDGNPTPFCSYYLTASDGRKLSQPVGSELF